MVQAGSVRQRLSDAAAKRFFFRVPLKRDFDRTGGSCSSGTGFPSYHPAFSHLCLGHPGRTVLALSGTQSPAAAAGAGGYQQSMHAHALQEQQPVSHPAVLF